MLRGSGRASNWLALLILSAAAKHLKHRLGEHHSGELHRETAEHKRNSLARTPGKAFQREPFNNAISGGGWV
jgi:hypothetical protein